MGRGVREDFRGYGVGRFSSNQPRLIGIIMPPDLARKAYGVTSGSATGANTGTISNRRRPQVRVIGCCHNKNEGPVSTGPSSVSG